MLLWVVLGDFVLKTFRMFLFLKFKGLISCREITFDVLVGILSGIERFRGQAWSVARFGIEAPNKSIPVAKTNLKSPWVNR